MRKRRNSFGTSLPLALILSLILATCGVFAQTGTEKIHNDKVTVFEVVLKPGERETATGKSPSLTVDLKSGETRFYDAGARAVHNTGKSDLHYVRIDFPGSGSAETWGSAGLAPNYKVILENRYARVYDIRIAAHTNEPQHTHHDRVVVCLSGAKLKHLLPDGHEEESTLKTGEITWRRGATHVGQNLGDTNLWVVAVEPK